MESPKNQSATQLAYVKREASFKQIQNQKKIKKKACFRFFLKTGERNKNKIVDTLVGLHYSMYTDDRREVVFMLM